MHVVPCTDESTLADLRNCDSEILLETGVFLQRSIALLLAIDQLDLHADTAASASRCTLPKLQGNNCWHASTCRRSHQFPASWSDTSSLTWNNMNNTACSLSQRRCFLSSNLSCMKKSRCGRQKRSLVSRAVYWTIQNGQAGVARSRYTCTFVLACSLLLY